MLLSHTGNGSNPPLARENRRLKIAGLVLMGVALPALFFLMDQVESKAWLTYQDNWQIWSIVLLYLVAANVFALGLIVLLAGLKNLPLLTDVQAKKGAVVKLAGANLLILLCLGFVALDDAEALGEAWKESWIVLLVLAFFVFAGRAGVALLRRGWKYDAIPAEKLFEQDKRPPIVYIRSFKDDNKIIVTSSRARSLFSVFQWAAAISVEQELAMIMNRVGPVVAIGKPRESLPELGAARLYVGDDEWRAKITDLMKQARLVVIRAGATANLWWEIDQCAKLLPPRQLLVSFGQGEDAKIFEKTSNTDLAGLKVSIFPARDRRSCGLCGLECLWASRCVGSFISVLTRCPLPNLFGSRSDGGGSSCRPIGPTKNRCNPLPAGVQATRSALDRSKEPDYGCYARLVRRLVWVAPLLSR